MNTKRAATIWWVPVAVAAAIAFALGIFGGGLAGSLTGALFGERQEIPLEDVGNIERRTDRLAGRAPAAPSVRPATGPPPQAEVVEEAETPDTRTAERLQLAFDSPLTPPVTQTAERIRKAAEARRAAKEAEAARAQEEESEPAAGPQPRAEPVMHVIARGSVIPALLLSPVDSELPGLVRAQVTRDIHDSLTGSHLLIPRGTSLIGAYGRQGQGNSRRLFVYWDELRLPDGTLVRLNDFSSLGPDGASGVKGRRSTGFLQALGATVLFNLAGNATTILTAATGIAGPQGETGALAGALGAALGNSTTQVTSGYIGALLNRNARFRIRAGSFMNVLVEQDLMLPAVTGTGDDGAKGVITGNGP